MKIEKSTYGYWVTYKEGRSRYFEFGTATANKIDAGLILDAVKNTREGFRKPGTHEPVVYFYDEEGKINIPPNPNFIPPGMQRLEIKNLRDADKLCREMSQELKSRFDFDATEALDDLHRDANGRTPRELVLSEAANAKTDYGREVCLAMLQALDKEESDRRRVNADVHFAWRES